METCGLQIAASEKSCFQSEILNESIQRLYGCFQKCKTIAICMGKMCSETVKKRGNNSIAFVPFLILF